MENDTQVQPLSPGSSTTFKYLPNELLRAITTHLPDEDLLSFCRVNKLCNTHGVLEFLSRAGRYSSELLSPDLGTVSLCQPQDREHRGILRGLSASLGPRTCQGFKTALDSADAARLVRAWIRRFPTLNDVHIQVGSFYYSAEPFFVKELTGLLHVLAGKGCESLNWEDEIGFSDARSYGLVTTSADEWKRYSGAHYGEEHPELPFPDFRSTHREICSPVLSWYLDNAPPMTTLQRLKMSTPTLFMRPFSFWTVNSLNASPIQVLELNFLHYHNCNTSVNRGEWYNLLDYLRLPSLRKFDLRCRNIDVGRLRTFFGNNHTITELHLHSEKMRPELWDTPPDALEVVSGMALSVDAVLSPVPASGKKNIFPNLRRVFIQQTDRDGPEDFQRALSALGLLSEDPSTPKSVALALEFMSVSKCAQFVGRSQENANHTVVFPEPYLKCVTHLEVTFPPGEKFNVGDGRDLFESVALWLEKFTAVDEVSLGLYTRGKTTLSGEDEEKVVRGILKHAPGVKRAKVAHEGGMWSVEEWRGRYP